MNKYRLAGVAAAAVVTTPMSAYALDFDFSIKGTNVTGEVLGLASSGSSGATDIIIDSDFAHPTQPTPFDFFPSTPF